ncbi:MAG: flagellar filament capping protein FliD [Myxococcales bacterium]|nr:flagellar filament capping protein FliD [Myxococcales bacterium]
MTIRTGGIASGLDTNSIIDQLVAIERAPINSLNTKKNGQTAQISTLAKIKAALQKIETAAKSLDTQAELFSMKTTSTAEASFTAKAAGNAGAGSYDVTVTQLAKAAKMRSAGIANTDLAVKSGTVNVTLKGGEAQSFSIAAGDKLADVAAKFNEQIDGATATVINDGTTSYITFTSDETGFRKDQTPADALVVDFAYTGAVGNEIALSTVQAAQNAAFTLDGLPVTSELNDVTSAITGVTLTLKKETTQAEKLKVETDPAAVETKLKALVDAYNEAVEMVTKETTVNPTSDRRKTLAGDATVRGIRNALSGASTGSIASMANTPFPSLASIGIKTDATGKLSIDSTKLGTALATSPTAISKLMNADDGILGRIKTATKSYTDADGMLTNRSKGLTDSVKGIDARIASLETRVETYKAQLVKQFTSMESALSKIQSQGNAISGWI